MTTPYAAKDAEILRLRAQVADLQRQLVERDAAMQAQARQWAADRMTEANYERG